MINSMFELQPILLQENNINLKEFKNGNYFISVDTNKMFLDINNNRLEIKNVEYFNNEEERYKFVGSKGFYLVLETNILYYYNGNRKLDIIKKS